MKSFMIYETPLWGNEDNVVYLQEVNNASYTLKQIGSDDITCYLEGIATKDPITKATCNKDDTYDFETGALIALMKKCGVEKVKKAAKETFFDVAENSVNEYEEEIKKLREEIIDLDYRKTCNETTIELLYNTINSLSGINDKYKELKEENEKLKIDCEKLQHGYIDTDMIFCGGRQNGKQYTFLVELFKKTDQKKVDTAYKEAYNTKLPLWQKEVLKQMYDSLAKPPTKREEMWNDILSCGDCERSKYVKVKKEDLQTFVKECNEKKIFNIIGYEFHTQEYWFDDDCCIFQIFRKPAGFVCAKSVNFVFKDTVIDYLPPMRWDLFKKGRLVVGVRNTYELGEFRKEIEINTGVKDILMCPTNLCLFYSFDKDNHTIILQSVEKPGLAKINGHKVVYWEDVR